MKKIFLSLLIMVAFEQSAISQSSFGLKAGANLSDQEKKFRTPLNPATQTQQTKPLFGYQFGVFYKVKKTPNLILSAEANFSLVGSRTLYVTEEQILNPDSITHYYHDKIGYIEVPLTLQYNFADLYFGAGPSIAFKFFSKITNFEGRSYNTPYYKTIDAAANVLAGCSILKKLDLNLRYSFGLVNIHEDHNYVKTKNRFLNLSVLYSLK